MTKKLLTNDSGTQLVDCSAEEEAQIKQDASFGKSAQVTFKLSKLCSFGALFIMHMWLLKL